MKTTLKGVTQSGNLLVLRWDHIFVPKILKITESALDALRKLNKITGAVAVQFQVIGLTRRLLESAGV